MVNKDEYITGYWRSVCYRGDTGSGPADGSANNDVIRFSGSVMVTARRQHSGQNVHDRLR